MTGVRYLGLAETELLKQAAWYEDRQFGLGDRMMAAVEEALALALHFPKGGRPSAANTRVVKVRRFPLLVVYRWNDPWLDIVAVAHERQRPTYWAKR